MPKPRNTPAQRRLIAAPEFPRYCAEADCREQIPGPDTFCGRHIVIYRAGELGWCLGCGRRMEDPAYWGNNCASCAPRQNSAVNRRLKEKHGQELIEKQDGKCAYCQCEITLSSTPKPGQKKAHLDHKKARIRGGRDNRENLHLVCQSCNSDKGATSHQDYEKIAGAQQTLVTMPEHGNKQRWRSG